MTGTFAHIGGQVPASEVGWAPALAGASAPAPRPYVSTAYRAASGMNQELAAFYPPMTSADSGVLPNARIALDRTRDLVRNDPHASAAISRLVDMLVGSGWQLIATPDARALGLTPEQARDIGRQIETEWKLFARHPRKFCDARRRLTMNGIFRLAAQTMTTAGEATAALKWKPARIKDGARYAMCIAMIDPDRMCNPNNAPDSLKVRGGVEFDEDGAPIAYHVRNAHLGDWWAAAKAVTWERIERETSWGRPVFIHGFEGDREDQTRAITPFAALVSRLRMIGKFADTELASATANALFTAFVESDLPQEEVAARLAPGNSSAASVRGSYVDQLVTYYTDNPATLGGVRLPVMLPGSKITMNSMPRQTTAFPAFQTAFLQSVAARLGISYEQLSMDWSRTNYSSARAALNEVWRMIKRLQAVFAEQFVQPIYLAFLEEAFDKGYVPVPAGAPDFWDLPEAWAASRWIGPGRGYVDPTKEAEASAMRMGNLTSSLQDECAEQGVDWEETLDQIAREDEELKARGIQRAPPPGSANAPRPADQTSDDGKLPE